MLASVINSWVRAETYGRELFELLANRRLCAQVCKDAIGLATADGTTGRRNGAISLRRGCGSRSGRGRDQRLRLGGKVRIVDAAVLGAHVFFVVVIGWAIKTAGEFRVVGWRRRVIRWAGSV